MNIQIIKQQLTLTKDSFKSIGLQSNGNGQYSILVELTPAAATQFQNLTAPNIDRQVNIVWQG